MSSAAFELKYLTNLELAPTSNKRPSKKWKKLISAQPLISARPLPPKKKANKKGEKKKFDTHSEVYKRCVDYFISSVAYNG